LKEWEKIGYQIKSHNSDIECASLLSNGLRQEQLSIVPVDDTAEQLFGKPIPRILPLLEYALQTDHDYFILTNSDIFPAHRKVISESLAKSFQSAAFTRTECLDLALCEFQSQTYYRGGLDLFWFTKPGLYNLLKKLRLSSVANRMTFGVPGWDYFLGHILSVDMNSPIIDGSIFIHQSHKTTYGRIDEFKHYAVEMLDSGQYVAEEPIPLADEFSILIRHKCENSANTARFLKLVYYKQPEVRVSKEWESRNNMQVILKQFSKQLDNIQVKSTFSNIELEIFIIKQNEGGGWPAAMSLANSQSNQQSYRFYRLQLLLLSLLFIYENKIRSLTLKYPQGNLHAIALKQIVQNEGGTSRERYIFDLFASELIDYGIVNPNLMKYLFTCTNNSGEKALFFSIISSCKQGLHNA